MLGCCAPRLVWLDAEGGKTSGEIDLGAVQTLGGLENVITTLLAGRAAEQILLSPAEVTVGAGVGEQSDLEKATQIALDIETRYGLGQFGLLHLPDRSRELLLHDKTVLTLISRRLESCHQRAEAIIRSHRAAVLSLAEALGDNGYLERTEILRLLQEHEISVPCFQVSPAGGSL